MSIFDTKKQSLERLLFGLKFHVELRGLAFDLHASPHEMYIPQLRKSESRSQPISHLDDISYWKGISNAQALELARWEHLFQQCLVRNIEECLRRSIIVQMKSVNEYTLLPCLLQTIPKEHIRFIDIDVQHLIHNMIDAFYDQRPGETAARNFRWSYGSEDLASFVYNFLCTHDCFRETPAGPCLYVKCTLDWTEYPCLSAVVHIASQPPDVRFYNIPVQIASRGQYIIAAKFVPVLSGVENACYQRYTGGIVYTVKKSSSIIQWDPQGAMFRAQAPDNTEETPPKVDETLIEARDIIRFPEGVLFQRVSRYAITISVVTSAQNAAELDVNLPQANTPKKPLVPLYTNTPSTWWVPPYSNTPLSKTRLRKRAHKWDLTHRSVVRKVNKQQSPVANKDIKHTNSVNDACFTYVIRSDSCVQSGSQRKRKPSLSEATTFVTDTPTDKTETGFKRQKLDGSEDSASEASIMPAEDEPIETVSETPTVHKSAQRSSPNNHDNSSSTPNPTEVSQPTETIDDIPAQYHVTHSSISSAHYPQSQPSASADADADGEEITFAPIYYTTPLTPSPTNTSSSNISPTTRPTTAAAESATSPLSPRADSSINFTFSDAQTQPATIAASSQEQIQNNYREFEEWAKRKRDEWLGEVGDMQFERVFWGDSEDEGVGWGESDRGTDGVDTDGLSEEVSALDLDAEG
ncbi:hypothetical protein PTT_18106 [Pyrenophora teres f. teres 0-1]|uniref:Uncharacterized protein n=1 Tax=Pyrenophora teres f. teres (strain 0-1) TaxID=861557 RepID=E3S5Z3_PYRTT|nr:hypothetical protein PTT_18106 [Pyrenophora teres f. teres 0-1]